MKTLERRDSATSYATKNSVPEKIRFQIINLLQDHLAMTIDLTLQAKQAHWNVKGPSFIALHELFDKVSEDAEEYVDLVAERIVQYGGVAEGTIQIAAGRTALQEFPLNISEGKDFVFALARALAEYGEEARDAIDKCDELGDKATADIFTEISRGVDKYLWFVEAHSQAPR